MRVAILVVSSGSLVSKLIKLGTMRGANHAAIELMEDKLIFEAVFKGIEVTKSDIWYTMREKGTSIHRVEFDVATHEYDNGLGFCWRHEKDKYYLKQFITFLPITRALFGRFIKDHDRAWVCSEFVEAVLREMNLNFVHKITKPSDVSPGTLLDSIRFEMGRYSYHQL